MNNKKELKKMLKDCIKNLDKFADYDEILVVVIQYRTQEEKYIADFHVNPKFAKSEGNE